MENNSQVLFYWLDNATHTSDADIVAKVKTLPAGSIAFAEANTSIYVGDTKFGIDAASFAQITTNKNNIATLTSVVDGLKFFTTITGDSGSMTGAAKPGANLPIKGDGKITTAVDTNGVTIKLTVVSGATAGTIKFGSTEIKVAGWDNMATTALVNDVLGTPSDAATANTVYGAKAQAAAASASVTALKTTLIGAATDATTADTINAAKNLAKEAKTAADGANTTADGAKTAADTHIANKSNPHNVTAGQVGLGNVTNESKATMFTNPAFTGTPTAPTAAAGTNSQQIATTAFVLTAVNNLGNNVVGALRYVGTIGATGATVTALPAAHKVGDVYICKTAGTYAGQVCEVGDMIVCHTEGTAAADAHWQVIQANINGAVTATADLTADQLVLGGGGKTSKILAAGTNGQILTMTGGKPAWGNAPTVVGGTDGSFTYNGGKISIGKPATAGTADKVTTALTIQLNGAAGTVFDGSAAKTVNITPDSIGAATTAQGNAAATALQTVSVSGSNYITASAAAKSGTNQNISVSATTKNIADATTANNGLAVAADVKSYVDNKVSGALTWKTL